MANVLSLGRGICDGNLRLSKTRDNLVLTAAAVDSITLQNWYAAGAKHEFVTLQLVDQASSDYEASYSNVVVNSKVWISISNWVSRLPPCD